RKGTMAERADVRLGDIILGFDARDDMSYGEIQLGIAAKRAGEIVRLNIWRGGAVKRIDVEVTASATLPPLAPTPVAREAQGDRLGLVMSASVSEGRAEGAVGVEVVESHGAALRAGIGPGDRILAINDQVLRGLDDYHRSVSRLPRDAVVAVLVAREGRQRYYALQAIDAR